MEVREGVRDTVSCSTVYVSTQGSIRIHFGDPSVIDVFLHFELIASTFVSFSS